MKSREWQVARRGQRVSTTREVFSLGIMVACILSYLLLSVDTMGAVLAPAILLSTLVFYAFLNTRNNTRRRWQAAWESYSSQDLSRKSFKFVEEERTFSLVGTN